MPERSFTALTSDIARSLEEGRYDGEYTLRGQEFPIQPPIDWMGTRVEAVMVIDLVAHDASTRSRDLLGILLDRSTAVTDQLRTGRHSTLDRLQGTVAAHSLVRSATAVLDSYDITSRALAAALIAALTAWPYKRDL